MPFRPQPWLIQIFAYCYDSCRLSRQLQAVNTVADFQDNCRQLQAVYTVADFQDNCRQLQTVNTTLENCRPLHCRLSVLVCSVRLSLSYSLKVGVMTMGFVSGRGKNIDVIFKFIALLKVSTRKLLDS